MVCYKRVLTTASEIPYTATCDSAIGYGGVGISITGNGPLSTDPPLKNDAWVLLCSTSTGQSSWYRVVHAGYDSTGNQTHVNLVGPDWYGNTTAVMVVVGGVTGVYTSTIQLN